MIAITPPHYPRGITCLLPSTQRISLEAKAMGQSAKGRLSVPKPGALPQFWENPEWSGGVPVNRPNDDSGSVRRGRICSALFFIFNSDSSFLRSEAHCECCFVKKFWRSASLLTLLHSRDGSASQVHETRRHGSSRAPARLSSGMPCSWRKIRRESLHFGTNAPQRAPVGFLEVFIRKQGSLRGSRIYGC